MNKKRNIVLSIVLGIIVLCSIGVIVFRILQDENAYTLTEKRYIIDNKSNLININVINDINVMGKDGNGVFYDFLQDFESDTELTFNIIYTSSDDASSGLTLRKSNIVPENSKIVYTDNYVLVGKKETTITNIKDVTDTIGYLNKDESVVKTVLNQASLTLKNYESKSDLLTGLENDEVSYVIVPMLEYLDTIIDKLYYIDYHFSGMKDYYFIQSSDDSIISSILNKFYNKWSKTHQEESFNKNEYDVFIKSLRISEKELDNITNKKYTYGFIDNAPYDVKSSGNYGGIMSEYITSFSKFSDIEFDYKEYNNFNKLKDEIAKWHVDLFVDYYGLDTSMTPLSTIYRLDLSFVMNNNDSRVINDIVALKNEVVYVKENSLLKNILESYGIKTDTYKKARDLKKIFKNNGIVAMEYSNYLVYKEDNKGINERFRLESNRNLRFQSKGDTMFNRMFSYYISTIDKNRIIYTGIEDYHRTVKSGTLIYNIAKYSLIIIIIIGAIMYVIYRMSKKTLSRKKIKRSDKIKYIDLLTSLKNRNYLTENTPIWNQNTIYPQAIVVIDLNGIQELNDSLGYEEGDKQIQAAANALIKTQLDNSEIMRTDGNEFTIYLVGYNEKQIISYVKKLTKEFKNLPHDKQAAIGFAMIENDVKLINDAINEATEKMKENKALYTGEDDEEKI